MRFCISNRLTGDTDVVGLQTVQGGEKPEQGSLLSALLTF